MADKRKEGVSFTVHRILASVADEAERWAAIEDAPFNSLTGKRSGRRTPRNGRSDSGWNVP